MKKNTKFRVTSDGASGFFTRAREHARKLDRKEPLAAEVTITFENAADLVKVLSEQRVRLLRETKKRPMAVSDLAAQLERDRRAVDRDVEVLESFGLVATHYETNPGHGRRKVVEPRAASFQLVANI